MKYVFRIIEAAWMASCFMIIVVIMLHCFGYDFRLVYDGFEKTTVSSDGRYGILELSDASGRYLTYVIVQLADGSDYFEIPKGYLFETSDIWYTGKYVTGYGWMDDTYNFYVESSDDGMHVYKYNGETWVSVEYHHAN